MGVGGCWGSVATKQMSITTEAKNLKVGDLIYAPSGLSVVTGPFVRNNSQYSIGILTKAGLRELHVFLNTLLLLPQE